MNYRWERLKISAYCWAKACRSGRIGTGQQYRGVPARSKEKRHVSFLATASPRIAGITANSNVRFSPAGLGHQVDGGRLRRRVRRADRIPATFLLDRVWDTPAGVRLGIFAVAIAACTLIPLALHRWIWRQRRLEQLARLLGRAHPSIGDQLLGIIELVNSESEQARSLALCQAAVHHVAEQARARDFNNAVPSPKHRRRAIMACGVLAVGVGLLALYPAAATNAWARFLFPWRETPRYTFAQVENLPDPMIVAHGEPFSLPVKLTEQTESRPAQAEARVGEQPAVVAKLAEAPTHCSFRRKSSRPPSMSKSATSRSAFTSNRQCGRN